MNTEIVTPIRFSSNFPIDIEKNPSKYLQRNYITNSIMNIFNTDCNIVFLIGDDGYGKTVIQAQNVLSKQERTISVFVNGNTRYGYNIDNVIDDMCKQVYWILKRSPFESNTSFNLLNKLIRNLNENAKMKGEYYYFVVDGIEEIPKINDNQGDSILDYLPFGYSNFRFIISKKNDSFYKEIPYTYKEFQLPQMSELEIKEILKLHNVEFDESEITEICRVTKNIPRNVLSIIRIYKTEENKQTFFDLVSKGKIELLEIEWLKNENHINCNPLVFSLIAFNPSISTPGIIGKILGEKDEVICKFIDKITFITINNENIIEFISISHRENAIKKLSKYKKKCEELLTDFFANNTEENYSYLAKIYRENGQPNKIIDMISPQLYKSIFIKSMTFNSIDCANNEGLKAAYSNGDFLAMLHFSLNCIILRDIQESSSWKSELVAHLEAGNIKTAKAIAFELFTKEDKLHALSMCIRKEIEMGRIPDNTLVEEVDSLISSFSATENNMKAYEIAGELFFYSPELSTKLLNAINNTEYNDNNRDLLYTRLSLSVAWKYNKSLNINDFDDIKDRIEDSKLREIPDKLLIMMGTISTEELLAKIDYIENAGEKLYLIIKWLNKNKNNFEINKIIEIGYSICIKSTGFSANANNYKKLCSFLPYINDKESALYLIGLFDAQRESIENIGPTNEYIKMQLFIAETELKFNTIIALNRFEDIYLKILYLGDIADKIELLSLLLSKIDKTNILKGEFENIKEEIELEFIEVTEQTAEHYLILCNTIKNVAKFNPEFSLRLANYLNTKKRRENAIKDCLISHCTKQCNSLNIVFIKKCIKSISVQEIYDYTILKIINYWEKNEEFLENENEKEMNESVKFILDCTCKINCHKDKCIGMCFLLRIIYKNYHTFYSIYKEKILAEFEDKISKIDSICEKTEICFHISASTNEIDKKMSESFLIKAKEFKMRSIINTESFSDIYTKSVSLLIRSMSGLCKGDHISEKEIEIIIEKIEFISAKSERILLFCKIAYYCKFYKKLNELDYIIEKKIKPFLDELANIDSDRFSEIYQYVFPILYESRCELSIEYLKKLSNENKEYAIKNTCEFIVTRVFFDEPQIEQNVSTPIDYDSSLNLFKLLEMIDTDYIIYFVIDIMSENITKCPEKIMTIEQMNEVCHKLQKIIDKKLPDKDNILHEGYAIISEMKVILIKNSYTKYKNIRADYERLISRAKNINNLADKAYVLSLLASNAKKGWKIDLLLLTKHALETANSIKSIREKISICEMVIDLCWEINKKECEKTAKNIRELIVTNNINSDSTLRSRLIDIVYKYDKELASSLASITDDDIVKKNYRSNEFIKRLEYQKTKNSIINNNYSKNDVSEDPILFAKMCYEMLGLLNSGKIITYDFEYFKEFFKFIYTLNLNHGFPFMEWFVQNCIRRFETGVQAKQYLKPLFENVNKSVEYAKMIIDNQSAKNREIYCGQYNDESLKTHNFSEGQRDKYIEFLKNWISEEVKAVVKIVDPYFEPKSLFIVKLLQEYSPKCKIRIVTSLGIKNKNKEISVSETFRNSWESISKQDPPDTKIIMCGNPLKNKSLSPIHDRWLITESSGLIFGSSINSPGTDRITSISLIEEPDRSSKEKIVNRFINEEITNYSGSRIKYESFTL